MIPTQLYNLQSGKSSSCLHQTHNKKAQVAIYSTEQQLCSIFQIWTSHLNCGWMKLNSRPLHKALLYVGPFCDSSLDISSQAWFSSYFLLPLHSERNNPLKQTVKNLLLIASLTLSSFRRLFVNYASTNVNWSVHVCCSCRWYFERKVWYGVICTASGLCCHF